MGEESILRNETRRSIYRHIFNYPGVQFTVLKEIFGIPEGTLRYHLRYLERKERVRSSLVNGRRCYYTTDTNVVEGRGPPHGSPPLTDVQEKILKIVRRSSGITQKELCSETSLNRFTLMYNLKKLMSGGYVRRYNVGREVHYEYISRERLEREVLRRAAIDLLKGRIDEDTFEGIASRFEED
ncbi:MAG: winged helix-turn-helix transcriptional regulator [Thermoplasmatota archaeon]